MLRVNNAAGLTLREKPGGKPIRVLPAGTLVTLVDWQALCSKVIGFYCWGYVVTQTNPELRGFVAIAYLVPVE